LHFSLAGAQPDNLRYEGTREHAPFPLHFSLEGAQTI